MHGLLRPLLLHTKPWQRAVLGVLLIAVGWFTGAIMPPVIGGVLVLGTVYGAVRSQQARRLKGEHDQHLGSTSPAVGSD
jgi:hypothetical protein